MKTLFLALPVALSVCGLPALAFDADLEAINRTAFEAVDANDDGRVSRREIDQYRGLVMLSQDADDDGIVTLAEYLAWDVGWRADAEVRGKTEQLRTARAAVFDFWDKNDDGRLSAGEQLMSQTTDFCTANANSNRPMDFETFTGRLRIIAAMNGALTEPEPVTLINVFEVPPEKLEETVSMWEASRDFLKTRPGYISTALHRSISPDARFRLINIAQWRDAESFRLATGAMRQQSGIKPIQGLLFDAALYQIHRTD
jgi:hypothetical protein